MGFPCWRDTPRGKKVRIGTRYTREYGIQKGRGSKNSRPNRGGSSAGENRRKKETNGGKLEITAGVFRGRGSL